MTTHTEELVQHIIDNAPSPLEEIKEIYDAFQANAGELLVGERYYYNETDVLNNEVFKYVEGAKVADEEATNERVPLGLHKVLVDQKVSYLVGEPMTFGSKTDNTQHLELIEQLIGEDFERIAADLLIEVSNKGKAWLRPYVDEEGFFAFTVAKAEQVIPLYEPLHNKLVGAIYFYAVAEKHVKLELWTAQDVTYYEMIEDEVYLDATRDVNPAPHMTDTEGVSNVSWERVPFIKFANNSREVSDLSLYKHIIDAIEKLVSKTQNTVLDVQELITILKGYDGESLEGFMVNLRRFKAIKVSEDGGVDVMRMDVPIDAFKEMLTTLRKQLIMAAQAVDPNPDVIGDAPSGVALKNLYGQLDTKASMFERNIKPGFREFLWFVAKYCELARVGTLDPRDITIEFTKSTVANETEIIDNLINSVAANLMSRDTAVTQHPYIANGGEEITRIAAQVEQEMSAYNERFGSVGGTDGEETSADL